MSRWKIGPRSVLFALMALGWNPLPANAQTQAPVVLPGSIVPLPSPAKVGTQSSLLKAAVDPEVPYISRATLSETESGAAMDFEVSLAMRDFAGLQARLAQGEHISPQEMAWLYNPTEADYLAVEKWLTGQGFTITQKTSTRLAIFASGTLSQIQKAMQVHFAGVTFEGTEYASAISAPYVPDTVATKLIGVNGLQPFHQFHKGQIKPKATSAYLPPYKPKQIAAAYQTAGLTSAGINGAGQTIAIIIDTFPKTSDLTAFWSICGISQSLSNMTFIQVVAGTLPKVTGEETLDVQWASSIAPAAKVRVYASRSLSDTSLNRCYLQVYNDAIAHPTWGLHQLSMSYGGAEIETSDSSLKTSAQYFAELASAGVTCFAAAGDDGADDDYAYSKAGLSAETPASDPNVTGVGGTSLTLAANGLVSKEVVWNDKPLQNGATGGGISGFFARPSWQRGVGVPSGTTRLVPDVAAPGSPQNGGLVIIAGQQDAYGGTSWSTPMWAGFCALLNQNRAKAGLPSLGVLGPRIYPLIGTTSFRDITVGNNAYDGFGYRAGIGYDLCTGVGVPNMTNLAKSLLK